MVKITFFNAVSCTKRVVKLTASWDGVNHEWDVKIADFFGEATRAYRCNPWEIVKSCAENMRRKDEYVTIKGAF